MSKDVLENEVNRPRTAPRSPNSVVAAAKRRLLTEQLLKGLMPLYVVRKPAHYILLLNKKMKYFLKKYSYFHASPFARDIYLKKKTFKKRKVINIKKNYLLFMIIQLQKVIQSNLAIRNFLVALKLFLNKA